MQTVGKRLQESHTRILEMSTQHVEQRVAQIAMVIGAPARGAAGGMFIHH